MIVAEMVVKRLCVRKELGALNPLTRQARVVGDRGRRRARRGGARLGTLGVDGCWHEWIGEKRIVDQGGAVFQAFQGNETHLRLGRIPAGLRGAWQKKALDGT